MTRRPTRALLLAAIAAGSGAANADAPPLPEEFLEYLGSWEADDIDWMVANAVDPRGVAIPASSATDGATRPTTPSTTTARGTSTATSAPGTERKP